METDKRPFYLWMLVIVANIGAILALLLFRMSDNEGFEIWDFVVVGAFLLLSVIPVVISKSNGKWKNFFGYGIPVLFLLPLPYFIYDFYTCTGKFCQIAPSFFGWVSGLSAVIFIIFYLIGIYTRKLNVKFIRSLMWGVIILILGMLLYFGPGALYSFNEQSPVWLK